MDGWIGERTTRPFFWLLLKLLSLASDEGGSAPPWYVPMREPRGSLAGKLSSDFEKGKFPVSSNDLIDGWPQKAVDLSETIPAGDQKLILLLKKEQKRENIEEMLPEDERMPDFASKAASLPPDFTSNHHWTTHPTSGKLCNQLTFLLSPLSSSSSCECNWRENTTTNLLANIYMYIYWTTARINQLDLHNSERKGNLHACGPCVIIRHLAIYTSERSLWHGNRTVCLTHWISPALIYQKATQTWEEPPSLSPKKMLHYSTCMTDETIIASNISQ